MYKLYPALKPNSVHKLEVSDVHTLYVEECGNTDGIPVLFVHGGPGAGCEPYHRQFFDPEVYRIILFDQRGCGKSTPHASLEDNTTQALVADMEKVREYFSIKKWMLFGGSWGSTLSLVYAETHPDRVLGLVLRGIFLCREKEIHWFYQEGASRIFPDYWQDFLKPISENERNDLLHAYHRRLTDNNELVRMQAAKAWSIWEGRCATLQQSKSVIDHFCNTHTALSLARIECHYFVNDSFLKTNQILQDAPVLDGIPGFIIHGRYDVVCPIESAWVLNKAWQGSELDIISNAGHSASEPGIVDALVRATQKMSMMLR
ncbi:MAG: prolyl aminopeptidase [Gammaproteobacteria bacterium]|nr:prolyl aminopeptidase [Gammaproteobacteria bacterium]